MICLLFSKTNAYQEDLQAYKYIDECVYEFSMYPIAYDITKNHYEDN